MRPKLLTAILLFISAYSPLALILAVRDIDFEHSHWFQHPIPMYIMLGITLISIVVLFLVLHLIKAGDMHVKVVSAKNKSVDIIGYTVPYMVAFFGIDMSKYEDTISLGIFLVVLLLLTIASKAIFLNPILLISGYGLYDLEYEYNGKTYSNIVISRLELKKGDFFNIRSLTRFLYFAQSKESE